MARIEKTVFISYRRADEPWALAVFENLTQHGYDVFIDYDGIASGNFATVILENIRARAHFLVLLTPTALERSSDPEDWMRREIEAALDSQRNIVPVMLAGFDFGTPAIASQLTGKLAALKQYNGLEIPKGYFSPAMERLRNKFLSVSLDTVRHPASDSAQQLAKEQKDKATTASDVDILVRSLKAELSQDDAGKRRAGEDERRRQQEVEIKQPADEEARQRKAEADARRRDEDERWLEDEATFAAQEAQRRTQLEQEPQQAAKTAWALLGKGLKWELLTWWGIIGGALTLFTAFSATLKLADWARVLLGYWASLAHALSRSASGWIGIPLSFDDSYQLLFLVF